MARPLDPGETTPKRGETLRTSGVIVGRYRWVICGLLFFATTINYLDRQVLGILAPTLQEELGWSEADYGWVTAAFTGSYAIGLLLVGRLMDALGTRRGFSLAVVGWSLAAMGHALSRTVLGFGVARSLLGLSEAGNFPAAIKTVAEWFPKKERALATGIFNAGSNVGAILAPLIVPTVATHLGWRWAFLLTGSHGFSLAGWLAGVVSQTGGATSPFRCGVRVHSQRPRRTSSPHPLEESPSPAANLGLRCGQILHRPNLVVLSLLAA